MNKKNGSLMWLVWLSIPLALIILAVVGGGAGYYLYCNSQYKQAVFLVETGEFADAQSRLVRLPTFYEDSAKLMLYAQAGEALEAKDYHNARHFYGKLGRYRDSKERLSEVDYRQAKTHLADGRHQDALELLEGLMAAGYRDSADLLPEAQLGVAATKLEAGEYKQAVELLKKPAARGLKGAGELLRKANYRYAVDLYRAGNFRQANELFSALTDYENGEGYYLLTQVWLGKFSDESYAGRKAAFQKMEALGKEEDIVPLLTGDDWIYYLLEGRWVNQKNDFELYMDDDGWYIDYSLPYVAGKFFKLEGAIVYLGSDETGWNKCFGMSFDSPRILKVHCYKDGSDYKLYKSPD